MKRREHSNEAKPGGSGTSLSEAIRNHPDCRRAPAPCEGVVATPDTPCGHAIHAPGGGRCVARLRAPLVPRARRTPATGATTKYGARVDSIASADPTPIATPGAAAVPMTAAQTAQQQKVRSGSAGWAATCAGAPCAWSPPLWASRRGPWPASPVFADGLPTQSARRPASAIALASAVHRAAGQRVRDPPITPDRLV